MFGRKKEMNQNPNPQTPSEGQVLGKESLQYDDHIHVMPDRFYFEENSSSGKKTLLVVIVIIVIFVIVIGVSAVVIYQSMSTSSLDGDGETTENAGINVEASPSPSIPTPTPSQSPTPVAIQSTPTPGQNSVIDLAQPSPSPTPALSPINPIAMSGATDLDNDGLTINEELIYSTNPSREDTDNDTFLDGEEIKNGFSPIAKNEPIEGSNLVKSYVDSRFRFQMHYPARWLQSTTDGQTERTVEFDSKIGESIIFTLKETKAYANIQAFISAEVEGSATQQVVSYTQSNISGLKTSDSLNYYFALNDELTSFLIIEYKPSDKAKPNFMTTLEMMLRSIKIL